MMKMILLPICLILHQRTTLQRSSRILLTLARVTCRLAREEPTWTLEIGLEMDLTGKPMRRVTVTT